MDVEVKLTGTLAARTGTYRARLGVDNDATVGDVVDALTDTYGPQVSAGVLDGDRLRTDTVAIREAEEKPLSIRSELDAGDTVRFQLNA